MAVAVVNKKQTGEASAGKLTITSATKGNLLVAFIAQTGTETAPKGKDNISGETGWTVSATSAPGSVTTTRVWLAYKTAVGGETELNPTVGTSGTLRGISYFEVSGCSETVDTIVASKSASAVFLTSGAVTTTDAGDIVLAGVANNAATMAEVKAWTGTGPMTNVETASTMIFGGSYIPGTTLTAVTFTANWLTARAPEMLVVALKPAGGGGALHGAIAATASASGVAQAAGHPAGVITATAAAAGKGRAAGGAKGTAASTAALSGKAGSPGAARGTAAATMAARGEARASGNPKGTVAATAGVAGHAGAPGILRGTIAATVTLAGKILDVLSGALKGTVSIVAGLAGKAQAPGHGKATIATAATITGTAQAPGQAKGTAAGTVALSGHASARGVLRGLIKALVTLRGAIASGGSIPTDPAFSSASHSLLIHASAGAELLTYAKGAESE